MGVTNLNGRTVTKIDTTKFVTFQKVLQEKNENFISPKQGKE